MERKAVYFYGIAPCTGGLAFGYDTGSMSGILAMPQFLTYFKNPSNFRQGGITASILAGAFAGSLLTGAFLADRLGRKRTILLGSAIFTIGCAISAAANNIEALAAGRVINGLGNGCLTMTIRGRIISVFQCFVNFGILIAFWIQFGTSHINGSAAWRLPMGLQMMATVALHVTMWFMLESPRWLVQKDRQEEALQVLAQVHAGGDIDDPYVQAELAEIAAKLSFEKNHPPPSYVDLLLGSQRRRMWIGIGVQFWQSMTGINVIMYYAVFLFQQTGLGAASSSLLANGFQGVVLNVFTYPHMYYMDKWGRRWPMVIGGVGMGISMMIIGVLMKAYGIIDTNFDFTNAAASRTIIDFVYIYVAWFAITWACVAWVYPPEIFSMSMRGRATSMTTETNYWKLYMIFMALCYLMSVVVYLFYPESAGKTLEEMDSLFSKGRSPWTFLDREATRVGALFQRDLEHGEALTVFDEDGMVLGGKVRQVEDVVDANVHGAEK
ncbi:general substrate transporter [Trichoderma compactum]